MLSPTRRAKQCDNLKNELLGGKLKRSDSEVEDEEVENTIWEVEIVVCFSNIKRDDVAGCYRIARQTIVWVISRRKTVNMHLLFSTLEDYVSGPFCVNFEMHI